MRKATKSRIENKVKKAAASRANTRGISGVRRRRGQTLLIAVLLMIVAALLGATFITVVALNLSQTTRGTNRSEAQAAAQAGLRYINDQITKGTEGEEWRPTDEQSPPNTPGTPEYDTYYSAFEQAQGWTYNATDPDRSYVKYPDPRAVTSSLRNSPTFLARVQEEVSNEREGQLIVEVIGRSADNDAVFARRLAYKPTSQNGGPGAFARYDSNYDFSGNKVVQTTVTGTANLVAVGTSVIQEVPVADARGFSVGRMVTATAGSDVLPAVVESVDVKTNKLRIKFARTVPAVPAVNGGIVRAASPLTGNIQEAQFDSTGAGVAESSMLGTGSTSTEATTQDAVGGVFINGGLALVNRIALMLRYDPADTRDSDKLQVAGIIARDDQMGSNNQTPDTITRVINRNNTANFDVIPANGTTPSAGLQSQVSDNSAAEAGDPTANIVRTLTPGRIDAPDSRYLKLTRDADRDNGSQYGYGPGVYIDNAEDVEKVGRLINGTTPDFRPLSVSDTQRLLQRKSFPSRAGEQGNITNTGTAGPFYRDTVNTSNNDGHRLSWPNPAASPTPAAGVDAQYYPLSPQATPLAATPTPLPVSLEERGVRGWISPWEYKPRGVLIELQGTEIIFTRDDRSNGDEDGLSNGYYSSDTNTYISNPAKAWKNAGGTAVGGGKIYRMKLDTATGTRYFGAPGNEVVNTTGEPFKGVIYAEGNVRVRGYLNATVPDVTIASMGNIYVEGSIRRDTTTGSDGHVALLAKNNVVLNPTLLLAQPAELTDADIAQSTLAQSVRITDMPGATDRQFVVSNLDVLRVGAAVRIGTSKISRIVTQVNTATNQVTIEAPGLPVAVPADPLSPERLVHLVFESKPEAIKGEHARRLDGTTATTSASSMGRLLVTDRPDDNNRYRFVFRHGAQQTVAFTLQRIAATPGFLQIKNDANSNDITEDAEKIAQLDTYPPIDLLQTSNEVGAVRADDSSQTIAELAERVNGLGAVPYDWNMAPNVAAAARRIPRFGPINNIAAGASFQVPLLMSGVFRSSVGLAQQEQLLLGSDPDSLAVENFTNSLYMNPLDLRFYQKSETVNTEPGMFWMSQARTALTGNWNSSFNPLVFAVANDPVLPAYYVGPMKLEQNGGDFSATTTNFVPGTNIEVDAQIYAQNGSWFVIPMPMMEPKIDVTSASYIAMTPAEQAAAKAVSTRFRRLNYAITVRGTISQNFAPPLTDYDAEVDPDGVATGPQQRWVDSLSHPTKIAADSASNKYGTDWTTIQYIGERPPANSNLKMPVSPDLLYVD